MCTVELTRGQFPLTRLTTHVFHPSHREIPHTGCRAVVLDDVRAGDRLT